MKQFALAISLSRITMSLFAQVAELAKNIFQGTGDSNPQHIFHLPARM
ncbi:MAG: hypothetical protein KBF32_04460 [Chitinophagales bacterium]|nr:hypothetical protein [Chitinophagales bacterium]